VPKRALVVVEETPGPVMSKSPIRIGLALGSGFARGIAHAGVLKIFDQHRVPIHCITGVSAGSIVAPCMPAVPSPKRSRVSAAQCASAM
jgi:predicted patatin/cPLA2 family phospholipase